MEILRAFIFHTPANPFDNASALKALPDGGLAVENGRIAACDDFATVRTAFRNAPVRDLRGSYLVPGFIDTHIHFPQARIIGGLGDSLLDWLDRITLPEEARLADRTYAVPVAEEFVRHLAAHGTTTALVFGAHFPSAMEALFEASARAGLRIVSGLVLSDRGLLPELRLTPDAAFAASMRLMAGLRGHSRLRYAVIPRFALSASEAMLEVCRTLLRENPSLHFTTHINENRREIEEVSRLFPWARDYFSVYERFDLARRRSVLAHNVHATDDELKRFAARQCSVAHCPCSNAALGSGIFPMARHRAAGVHFALGTDVGGGTGFGMLKEALQAYLMQRVAGSPFTLTPAQMLYLATRAGAEALEFEDSIGDFSTGKAADFVCLRPPAGSVLAGVLNSLEDPERILAALITLAGPESIGEVRVEGDLVYEKAPAAKEAFVTRFGGVYEHSPWVAERAWNALPSPALDSICDALRTVVANAGRNEQLNLLRAHPDLGTRARVSPGSADEQASAGLSCLTQPEYDRLLELNTAYKAKFGFPFLYAVKGSNKFQILAALETRLQSTPEAEFRTALEQVYRIARFRLEDMIP